MYLDYNTIKKINLDFSEILFSSDNNVIYTNPIPYPGVAYKEAEQFELFTNNRPDLASLGKTFTKIFFRSSPSSIIIDRIYQKLSFFLANLVALISNILLGLFIFISFLNEFWAEQKVMNKILKFKEHFKVKYSKQLDEIKNKIKKNILMMDSSLPQVNDESIDQKKISE